MSGPKGIPWWEQAIPRLQTEIKGLELDRARATYRPTIRRIEERLQMLQCDLNNALRAAALRTQAQTDSANTGAGAPRNGALFTHSPDYRSVTICGRTYSLTPRQAQMIEILHRIYELGVPEVGTAYVLEQLETPNSRWQDTFKNNQAARKALIAVGTKRGNLRLNL